MRKSPHLFSQTRYQPEMVLILSISVDNLCRKRATEKLVGN